jgi:hypothetical protein
MPNPSTIENSEVSETSPASLGSEVTAVPAIDQPADAVTESASASSVPSPVGGEDGNGESVVTSMTTDSPAPSSSLPAEVVPEVAPVEVVPEVTPEVTPEVETPESTSPVAPPEASEPAPIIGGGGFEVPADLPPAPKVPTMVERLEALEARVAALEG